MFHLFLVPSKICSGGLCIVLIVDSEGDCRGFLAK